MSPWVAGSLWLAASLPPSICRAEPEKLKIDCTFSKSVALANMGGFVNGADVCVCDDLSSCKLVVSPSCVSQALQRLVIGGGVPVEEAERTIAREKRIGRQQQQA